MNDEQNNYLFIKYLNMAESERFPQQTTQKVTPVDTDWIPIADSQANNALKKITRADIKGDKGDSIVFRWAYNGATAYVVNDVVTYTDWLSYICIANSTGNIPTNVTFWTAIFWYVSWSESNPWVLRLSTSAQRATGTASVWWYNLAVGNNALVKTSSWAGDENKVPILDDTGKLDSGFLPPTWWEVSATLWETINAWATVVPRDDGKIYNYAPSVLEQAHSIASANSSYVWALTPAVHIFLWYDGTNTLRLRVGALSSGTYTFWTTLIASPWSWQISQLTTQWLIFIRWSATQFSLISRYLRIATSNYDIIASQYTVSWTTITHNADVTVFSSTSSSNTLRWACLIAPDKVAITYSEAGTTERVRVGQLAWTVLTLWTALTVSTIWVPAQVATDIFLIAWTTEVRRYTVSWTTVTQGNNLAYWATLSTQNINTIANWRVFVTGTVSWNTVWVIINWTPATPTRLTVDTLVLWQTHTVSIPLWNQNIWVVTWTNNMNIYSVWESYSKLLLSQPIPVQNNFTVYPIWWCYVVCINATNWYALSFQKLIKQW